MRYRRLLRKQNGKCWYCGVKLISPGQATTPNDPRVRSLDHVVPKFFGGVTKEENLVYACRDCNNEKGWQPPDIVVAIMLAERNKEQMLV